MLEDRVSHRRHQASQRLKTLTIIKILRKAGGKERGCLAHLIRQFFLSEELVSTPLDNSHNVDFQNARSENIQDPECPSISNSLASISRNNLLPNSSSSMPISGLRLVGDNDSLAINPNLALIPLVIKTLRENLYLRVLRAPPFLVRGYCNKFFRELHPFTRQSLRIPVKAFQSKGGGLPPAYYSGRLSEDLSTRPEVFVAHVATDDKQVLERFLEIGSRPLEA
ncbi:hypothetical protein BY996DRAFT_1556689 [Phakopsora pachyrhizi]|nr:hypothetical protein BY996DRAFT_1556689 [Phakopsora pachyrhizi]